MADEETKSPKKGDNKIVIIGICVMMLVTGGFVGLKFRGGGAAAKEAGGLQLSKEILPVDEFLVNLQDDGTHDGKYLRTKIAVQCAEGFKKEDMDANLPTVQDAMIRILSANTVPEITKPSGRDLLKRNLAIAANTALVKANSKDFAKFAPQKAAHNKDWDCDSGPILKVYFTSFAFQ